MLRPIKNWLIYVAVKTALSVIGRAPLRWVPAIGRGIGALAYTVAVFERKTALVQLQLSFGEKLSAEQCGLLARGVFYRLGWSAVELARMIRDPDHRPNVLISEESRRVLDNALALKRGVIFVTAHLGNWELMAATLARLGYPIYTVAKKSYDSRFTKMIDAARSLFGVRSIYRGDKGSAAAMLRALRNNGVLGFLIDQDTDVPSVFAPFFGRPAKTPTGPAVFALRTGAPIAAGVIRRNTKDGSHRIDIVPFTGSRQVDEMIAELNLFLEARIRKHPSEWVWFHRRWKSADHLKPADDLETEAA